MPLFLILTIAVIDAMIGGIGTKFKYPFSYISPIFGGSYRIPIALNDSNFDYGQDVFYVQAWIEQQRLSGRVMEGQPTYAIVSGHARVYLEQSAQSCAIDRLELAVEKASKLSLVSRNAAPKSFQPLIVSRGLTHPEPWGVGLSHINDVGDSTKFRELVRQLLLREPIEWITPTMGVYDCGPVE